MQMYNFSTRLINSMCFIPYGTNVIKILKKYIMHNKGLTLTILIGKPVCSKVLLN